MMQLRHSNVNEFIGASISPPAVYVCMAFCPKGSVWDVINRQSILLSWDFRLSLIVDIAKVLQCFHGVQPESVKLSPFPKTFLQYFHFCWSCV